MLHEVNRVGLVFGHTGGLGGTEVDGQLNDQNFFSFCQKPGLPGSSFVSGSVVVSTSEIDTGGKDVDVVAASPAVVPSMAVGSGSAVVSGSALGSGQEVGSGSVVGSGSDLVSCPTR